MTDKTGSGSPSLDEQVSEMLKRVNQAFNMGAGKAMAREEATKEGVGAEPGKSDALGRIRDFNMKPRDVKRHLDRYVIRQDDAKRVLSVAICDHYNHVRRCLDGTADPVGEYLKHNILLLGPTGVGKTYLVRCLSKLIGVPFVKADATKFSETGYVGHDVEDLVRDLVKVADGDVELAQYGIIYLDEVDKLAGKPGVGRDVSGRGVQTNLLKLMEETDVGLFSQTDLLGQVQAVMEMQRGKGPKHKSMNTRHILFIASGAFDGLAELVRKRLRTAPIGFAAEGAAAEEESEWLRKARTSDMVEYGFEPEFVGRLPVRVVCDKLTADDLCEVLLRSEGSVLRQYEADLAGFGIRLTLEDSAARTICARAVEENTGARGLMTVMERLLRNSKFELPSSAVRDLRMDDGFVADPQGSLDRLLREGVGRMRESLSEELVLWAASFQRETEITLTFTDAARDRILEECEREGLRVAEWADKRLHDLEYAARLITRNSGRQTFSVTDRIVQDPERELSRRVAQSFEKE